MCFMYTQLTQVPSMCMYIIHRYSKTQSGCKMRHFFQLKQLRNKTDLCSRMPNQKWESSKLVILRPPAPHIFKNFRHSSNILHLFQCKSLPADLGLARWPCYPEVQVRVRQQQISCIKANPIVIDSTTKCYLSK